MFKLLLSLLFLPLCSFAFDTEFRDATEYVRYLKYDKAIDKLERLNDLKIPSEKLPLKYFSLASWHAKKENWLKVEEYATQALALKTPNIAQAHYLLGHACKMQGKYQEALNSFNRVIELNPPPQLVYLTRFEFSEIATLLNRPLVAHAHLKYLERRWTGTDRHPEIVWKLIGVELKRNNRMQACKWARKMYSKYPAHALVAHWGVDLQNNAYDEKPISCISSNKELKTRIKRLQLSGQAERARNEINTLIHRAGEEPHYELDLMLVEYLDFQGYADEALATLIKYYKEQQNNFGYQLMLAKVASKAGEFPTAVGAYYKAHRLNAGGKKGREALFSAAFLSYQFQDYDGATRKFQDLVRKYPGSGLSRDSRWHLAWLRYLRGDYKGASGDFQKLASETYRRRRRIERPFDNERTHYWHAVSELKQNNYVKARELFSEIAKRNKTSYYAAMANERLKQIPSVIELRQPTANSVLPPLEIMGLLEEPLPADQPDESDESEETVSDKEEEDAPEPVAEVESPEEAQEEQKEEPIQVSEFQDPKLQERFSRAQFFIQIGAEDWARWELFEIERRTRNKTYLKNLMEAYMRMGFFHRTAYISEIYFSSERSKLGVEGARDLWKFNFPRAFEAEVTGNSAKFDIDKDIIWSIMRAESSFNPDATSPVGALGLMQVMPYTAERLSQILGEKSFDVNVLKKAEVNVRYGARYLSRLNKKFAGELPLVAAAYNAGPHRVDVWLNSFGNLNMDEFVEHIPYVETRNYVKKVSRNYLVYKNLYRSAENMNLAWMISAIPVKVESRPSARENWETLD